MKLYFDIGCCIGRWIEANYSPDIMFVGIEPHKLQFKNCTEKFENKLNVKILNYLVADKFGVYDLYPYDEISTASKEWMTKSRHRNVTWSAPYLVPSITLDYLIEMDGIPDYIKIDAEGFEYEVLKGLTQKVGMIAFEFVEEIPGAVWNCMKYLYDLGYVKFAWTKGDQYDYKPEKWTTYKDQVDEFKHLFRRGRQGYWGMIYCI